MVLISGGTGMIGTALTKVLLDKGQEVCILTRNPEKARQMDGIRYAAWDPDKGTVDKEVFKKAEHIVHLAGANVGSSRWTRKRKKEIIESRVRSGDLISRTLKEVPNHVQSVVSLSAIGYYGPDPSMPNPHPFRETDAPYNDFLAGVVKAWEAAIMPVEGLTRLVIFRSGIVLSTEGGAYKEFSKPFRFGFATILGNGKQVVSWIHIDDMVKLILFALENKSLKGVYNSVAPHPVTNENLIRAIRKHHSFSIPFKVPEFVLKTVLGEMSIEVLKSATVSSEKLQQTGFEFDFPDMDSAIRKLEAS